MTENENQDKSESDDIETPEKSPNKNTEDPEGNPESPKAQEDSETEGDAEEDMFEYLTMYGGYQLASNMQYIRQAGYNQYPVHKDDSSHHIYETIEEIEKILRYLDLTPILSEIFELKKRLDQNYVTPNNDKSLEDLDDDDDNSLSPVDGRELGNKATTWQQVIKYEISNQERYVIKPVPIIDIEEIINNPSSLFDDNNWEKLPEQTQRDLRESATTLGANCATASVIMALRGVEDVLREWYKEELDKEEPEEPWGAVLSELEDYFDTEDEDPGVLSNLDYLRTKRNEVNHPVHSPSDREAAVTLAMASETISEILSYLDISGEMEIND